MDDEKIIELYWARKEDALAETDRKYGAYLNTVAGHILDNCQDSEECVSDAYMRAWNAMPPHKPAVLRAFLAKITRECAIDCFRRKSAKRRKRTEYDCSLDELGDILSDSTSPEKVLESRRLTEVIEAFLAEQTADHRRIFLCRYYFIDPVRDIAVFFGCSESKIKSILYRMRQNLREYLIKEDFDL
ncbi:MAG: sigma-70 family RNA polymerase sigma factor [Clostridia bacterium]|nr:sigma-70 family RNA polymerase sigma factor [Clostridia bacterium]